MAVFPPVLFNPQDNGEQPAAILDWQAQEEPGKTSTKRTPVVAGPEPGDRRLGQPGSGGVHPADWTACGPDVSAGGIGMAADSGSGARLAQHWLSSMALFSVCPRQRNPADEVRPLH